MITHRFALGEVLDAIATVGSPEAGQGGTSLTARGRRRVSVSRAVEPGEDAGGKLYLLARRAWTPVPCARAARAGVAPRP